MRKRTLAVAVVLATLLPLLAVAAAAEPFEAAGPLRRVSLRELATSLGSITAIAHDNTPGSERLYLALREGQVVIWDGSRVLPQPFLDIQPLVGTAGEGGLLGLAFYRNDQFFVHYTDTQGDTRLVRYLVQEGNPDRADPASAVVFLTVDQPSSSHNGGQLTIGLDGYLYLGLGDGGVGASGDPRCNAQRRGTLLGKILRIDVFEPAGGRPYAIPEDNPFVDGPFLPEVWATGLRNPWRFSFDRANGDLWIADVGQAEREEINLQPVNQGGRNWGWSPMEGSLCFGTNGCPNYVPRCNAPGLATPLLEYGHDDGDCAVTGGYVYRGPAGPRLHGTYLFGDFCSGRIWGARRENGSFVVREMAERVPLLTTFGEDAAGEIYLGTAGGRLLRLEHEPRGERVGLYDPARAQFHLRQENEPGPAEIRFAFGRPGSDWLPLAGDWDGDGKDTVGFYEPATSRFRLHGFLASGTADVKFVFGPRQVGWLPVVGDWDGDGRDGVGLYDPVHSVFHLRGDQAGDPLRSVQLGPPGGGWLPVAGQFDGDPGHEVGLYDPAAAVFHLEAAGGERVVPFGRPDSGWLPLAGDWDGVGLDGVGLYDPAASRFHLDDLTGQPALVFQLGQRNAGWLPVAGSW